MSFVKEIRVGEERLQAGLGAEIDRPVAISDPREICRIGVAEDPPTEGDEARTLLLFERIEGHTFTALLSLPR